MKKQLLYRFVVLLYGKSSTRSDVNVVRCDLFARKGRYVNNIPPTQGALLRHARRATYRDGHCWSQAIEPLIEPKRAGGWAQVGTDGGMWDVVWSYLPEANKIYSPFAIWVNLRLLLRTRFFWWINNPMGSLKKLMVVLWTTLGNCVNMQISDAITETSIFFNILENMHYIISKIVSTHMFTW